MKKQRTFIFLLLLFIIPGLSGCGADRPKDLPKLYPITLQFTQGGAPCASASVSLISLDGGKWVIGGSTDASGNLQPKTHGQYPGVPAGKYRITVRKTEQEEPKSNSAGSDPMASMMTPVVDSYNLIDTQYASRKDSPLEIEVGTGKNTYEPFDLGEPIRVRMKQPGER